MYTIRNTSVIYVLPATPPIYVGYRVQKKPKLSTNNVFPLEEEFLNRFSG